MNDTAQDDQLHLQELVSRAQLAMLTTVTSDGRHVSRPMALQKSEFDGDLWFFAYEDSAVVAQVRAEPEVNVSFTDQRNSSWTSVAGRAEVVHDRTKADDLYGPALKIWFPDGPETPGLTLIKVHADSAQYWEGPSSTIGKVAGGIRALVTRSPEKDPFDTKTINL
jgi:general stress protein 26